MPSGPNSTCPALWPSPGCSRWSRTRGIRDLLGSPVCRSVTVHSVTTEDPPQPYFSPVAHAAFSFAAEALGGSRLQLALASSDRGIVWYV